MSKNILISLVFLLAATGCAVNHKELDSNPPFSAHRYSNDDLEITWRTENIDGNIRLTGAARNHSNYYFQDLELIARVMDSRGKVIAKESYLKFPDYLPPGKSEPFQLDFHLPPGNRVERILFSYLYWLAGSEGAAALRVYEDVPRSGTILSLP